MADRRAGLPGTLRGAGRGQPRPVRRELRLQRMSAEGYGGNSAQGPLHNRASNRCPYISGWLIQIWCKMVQRQFLFFSHIQDDAVNIEIKRMLHTDPNTEITNDLSAARNPNRPQKG